MNRSFARMLIPCAVAFLIGGWPGAARAEPEAIADLAVTVEVTPNPAALNEQVLIEVFVDNLGDASAVGNIRVDLYVDPASPPTAGDDGVPIINLNTTLIAGGFVSANTTRTFTTNGVKKIYAWVDRAGVIAESSEANNLVSVDVQVGESPSCVADAFESDNSCATSQWLQSGSPQQHNLCNPAPDVDWVKFTGFAGVNYTVGTSKPVTSTADPQVTIFASCGGATLGGPALNQSAFTPANSGVYYARVQSAGANPTSGADYTLSLASNTGITDNYEPDDSCATANEIATTGATQSHRFNKVNDEDWVRFTAKAGESFVVTASGANGANPVLSLSSSCADAAANNPLAAVTAASGNAQLTGNSLTQKVYYVMARNDNGAVFGADKTYTIGVSATACGADGFEDDDVSGQAKPITVGAQPQAGRTTCPPADYDWVKFNLVAGKTYVIQTLGLGAGADTVLTLFGPNSVQVGENDDFGYTKGSRLVVQATVSGAYTARIRHANASASGATTNYSVAVQEGFCLPDNSEGSLGDNGPGDARAIAFGTPMPNNFCADPLDANLGDQDWVTFSTVANGRYQVKALGTGSNADPVIELYDANGSRIKVNDDAGLGRSAVLSFTVAAAGASAVDQPQAGPVYVRVLQFDSNVNGGQTDYQVQVAATVPPTPTPTPTPTPVPPTPTPTPNPASARTIFVINMARMTALYDAGQAANLLAKINQVANLPAVDGAVVQVDAVPAVASAYTAWLADPGSTVKANAVTAAIRNLLMTFLVGSSKAKYVVIVGDDRVIPFRRVPDLVSPQGQSGGAIEQNYAISTTANSTIRAALSLNMILTDDYYVDKQPGTWEDNQDNTHDLYLPDFGVSRLIETPAEIAGLLNQYIAENTIPASRVAVTGYDFVQDGADTIETLFDTDGATTSKLIGTVWTGAQLRSFLVQATPEFDITSINGHSTHLAIGSADENNVTAAEVDGATKNMAGKLVFSLGCHGGLNDPGLLDLPQAYARNRALYIGNTGYGWGGGGVVYSEALFRNFVREILREQTSEVGQALAAAKVKYYTRAQVFNAYDAKILMQTTLYGMPNYEVTSGGSLAPEDPFPSAEPTFTPPTSFAGIASGAIGYGLPGSFGAFGEDSSSGQGTVYDLDGTVEFASGLPVQPGYFGSAAAPNAGTLRGVVFLGGNFQEEASFDPVIALADNEYVTDKSEPAFAAQDGWHPALPFVARGSSTLSATVDSVVLSLGQFSPGAAATSGAQAGGGSSGVQRIYDQMSFSTFYSFSADESPANLSVVDGVLNPATGKAAIKVETTDQSGINKVVVAYTEGANAWKSKELTWTPAAQKWIGEIPATTATVYFIQVVDGAGNVKADDNKGKYFSLPAPLPLKTGKGLLAPRTFLPAVRR